MYSAREHVLFHAFIFFVAVLLNLAWEVAQIHAYDFPESTLFKDLIGCFIPSLGDGLMVLIIYWTGWSVFRSSRWVIRPGTKGYFLMIASGLFLAIVVELTGVYWREAWAYNERMITVLGIGVLPALQMVILPPVTFLLIRWIWTMRNRNRNINVASHEKI